MKSKLSCSQKAFGGLTRHRFRETNRIVLNVRTEMNLIKWVDGTVC